MHNPSGLLAAPVGPQRFVRVKAGVKGFLQGSRYMTPADPPFQVDDFRAAELVRLGVAEACAPPIAMAPEIIMSALNPSHATAERATAPRQRR